MIKKCNMGLIAFLKQISERCVYSFVMKRNKNDMGFDFKVRAFEIVDKVKSYIDVVRSIQQYENVMYHSEKFYTTALKLVSVYETFSMEEFSNNSVLWPYWKKKKRMLFACR